MRIHSVQYPISSFLFIICKSIFEHVSFMCPVCYKYTLRTRQLLRKNHSNKIELCKILKIITRFVSIRSDDFSIFWDRSHLLQYQIEPTVCPSVSTFSEINMIFLHFECPFPISLNSTANAPWFPPRKLELKRHIETSALFDQWWLDSRSHIHTQKKTPNGDGHMFQRNG